MILEIKAIFKNKMKARRAFEQLKTMSPEKREDMEIELLEGNDRELFEFNFDKLFNMLVKGTLLGGFAGLLSFFGMSNPYEATSNIWIYGLATALVAAVAGLIIAFMIFFIRREYRILMDPDEIDDEAVTLSVVCNDKNFSTIERLLKTKKPDMILTS